MAFDMRQRTEGQFLEEFDGTVVEAGWIEGYIPGERTRTGQPRVSHQLVLKIRPDDEEAGDQLGFYSMGGKEYRLGGRRFDIEAGAWRGECYEQVVDGPAPNRQSKLGKLLDRLEELGWVPAEGDRAGVFVGLRAHWAREEYEARGQVQGREVPMPTRLLDGQDKRAAAGSQADAGLDDDALVELADGSTFADLLALRKRDGRLKALSISALDQRLRELVRAGRLVQESEEAPYVRAR